ncbi:helix-turn-helix domain-containing protein [Flavobacterium cerinum]|uniref:XRE family transcriptional regulator n=1 Tax=Flavobacterium cerinum TaxID=2502784 RepID=A0A444HBP3_9FLAO|nr:helix-turn-helix transcriptional regulator [Flavobacterium cerinum]RWX00882.1 XRE family transcriptional regulator [Flavobacterium cerinum]
MDIAEDKFLISLGQKVKEFRESKNFSQEDLANDCNIPKSQIGRIERAEINTTMRTLIKIAQALGVKVRDLIEF